MKRFCMFGDSVGKGVIYDEAKQRYTVIKDSFASTLSERLGIAVDNFCSFGCTMRKGAEMVERRLESLNDYGAVILEFGGNDCDFDWAKVAESPLERHECKTPLKQFVSGYIGVVERIKRAGGLPVIMSVPAINAEKYYRWISRENDGEAIMRFLGETHSIEHWNELYNNAVWRVAAAENVPVIDIRSPLLRERGYRDYFCEDGIHLNRDGHRLISDSIYESLGSAVCA